MKGLCNKCHESNKTVIVSEKTGEPICMSCDKLD